MMSILIQDSDKAKIFYVIVDYNQHKGSIYHGNEKTARFVDE